MADRLSEMRIVTLVHSRFFGWRSLGHILRRHRLLSILLRQCANHKIDLIHCSYPWYSQYGLCMATQLKCPCVIHARSPLPVAKVKKSCFERADNIVAVSARIRKDLINAGISPDKITLIVDSVDTDLFGPHALKRQHFSRNGELVIGLVGRIEPAKHQMEFVHAAGLLAARNNKVKFAIVGQERDAVYTQQLKNYIQNFGLCDRITLFGRSENMPEILNGFDILVSLSGGSVMYEAMACGIPVLSAGFTNKEDSVYVIDGYNAMLLDNREPSSIAVALEKLLTDGAYRQSLANNTRSHVMQHLSGRIMAAQTQTLYERLLNRYQTVLPNKGNRTHE